MNRGLWLVALSLAALLLGGCVDHAPAYREALLAFDEGLIGNWEFVQPIAEKPPEEGAALKPGVIEVAIARRDATVTHGRLGQFNRPEGAAPKNEHRVPAYHVTIRAAPEKPEEKAFVRTYDAVLLDLEGTRFVAYQLASDEAPVKEYMGDVLPVHKVVRVDRRGDTLRTWTMKRQIVWLPVVQPLEKEAGPVRLPDANGDADGVFFVSDPERFVEAIRLAVKRTEWDDPLELKRVP